MESGSGSQPDDALVDLLIKQATEGLSSAERTTLDSLADADSSRLMHDFERAAAAVSVAAPLAPPPPALLERLAQQARAYVSSGAMTAAGTAGVIAAQSSGRASNAVDGEPLRAAAVAVPPTGRRRGGTLGWYAAAACLLLAVAGWWHAPGTTDVTPPAAKLQPDVPANMPPPPVLPPAATPTLAEERAGLLANADSLKVTLGATKDPAGNGVTADAVWDPATQKGFLRVVGLATNDPRVRQYQIWIFDGERDKRYPVDGGVFDVPAGAAEVIIPIHAALPIRTAKAFAVTVEKPGGVVVSALGHVVALGAAG